MVQNRSWFLTKVIMGITWEKTVTIVPKKDNNTSNKILPITRHKV